MTDIIEISYIILEHYYRFCEIIEIVLQEIIELIKEKE